MLLGFSRSLSCIVNASNHTKCASLNNQQCMIPNKIEDLNLNACNMIVRIDNQKHWQNIHHANTNISLT